MANNQVLEIINIWKKVKQKKNLENIIGELKPEDKKESHWNYQKTTEGDLE